jgi:hypothetical protein
LFLLLCFVPFRIALVRVRQVPFMLLQLPLLNVYTTAIIIIVIIIIN